MHVEGVKSLPKNSNLSTGAKDFKNGENIIGSMGKR